MPITIMPKADIEKFVLVPATGSHVYTSKTVDYRGKPIKNLTGYDEIRMAQALGLNTTSSAEWGKSRRYFQDHPDQEFAGKRGADIEKDFISRFVERTSTLLAFRGDSGDFAEDVHDLLKDAGFDGKIALIDFPYVQEESDIFIPGNPRMRIVDVSDKLPSKDGHIQAYDDDLGMPTKVGEEPNPDYYGAYFRIRPEGTRQIIRCGWHWPLHEDRRFDVLAHWEPSRSDSHVASRLSSGNEPPSSELGKARVLSARKEIVGVCERYGLNPDDILRDVKE